MAGKTKNLSDFVLVNLEITLQSKILSLLICGHFEKRFCIESMGITRKSKKEEFYDLFLQAVTPLNPGVPPNKNPLAPA